MKSLVNIFFSSDRIYITSVEPSHNGMVLNYVNSTEFPVDLEHQVDMKNPQGDNSLLAIQELEIYLSDINPDIARLSVTLPGESILVSQFPGNPDINEQDLIQLIQLELRQAYPSLNYKDITANIVPLSPGVTGKQMILAVIIPNSILIRCNEILAPLGIPIDNIEISQLNAHSSFLYNYPENFKQTALIAGIQKQFIDISIVQNSKPVYYSLLSYTNTEEIGKIIMQEVKRIRKDYVDSIDIAKLFGVGLNSKILDNVKNELGNIITNVNRLNAFRMISTQLEDRVREYCKKVAHIYPPCIGGCLPAYHQKINLA